MRKQRRRCFVERARARLGGNAGARSDRYACGCLRASGWGRSFCVVGSGRSERRSSFPFVFFWWLEREREGIAAGGLGGGGDPRAERMDGCVRCVAARACWRELKRERDVRQRKASARGPFFPSSCSSAVCPTFGSAFGPAPVRHRSGPVPSPRAPVPRAFRRHERGELLSWERGGEASAAQRPPAAAARRFTGASAHADEAPLLQRLKKTSPPPPSFCLSLSLSLSLCLSEASELASVRSFTRIPCRTPTRERAWETIQVTLANCA